MTKVFFGRTAIGQLLYDLAFAKLSDRWIAKKHKLPVGEVRKLRAAALNGLKSKRKKNRL